MGKCGKFLVSIAILPEYFCGFMLFLVEFYPLAFPDLLTAINRMVIPNIFSFLIGHQVHKR